MGIIVNGDQRLMIKASEVKAQIDTHEAICSERWRETITRIKRIEALMIGTSGTAIVLLIGLLVR